MKAKILFGLTNEIKEMEEECKTDVYLIENSGDAASVKYLHED
jgi:hypothetical protein